MSGLLDIFVGSKNCGKTNLDHIDHRSNLGITYIPHRLIRTNFLNAEEKEILFYLMSYNWYTSNNCDTKGFVFLSMNGITENLGLSRKTIHNRLCSLQEKGIVYRVSNTHMGYKSLILDIKKKYGVNVVNVSITFIDLFSLFSEDELCHYLKIDSEEYHQLLSCRDALLLDIKELDLCEYEEEYQNKLDDIFTCHIQFETPYVHNAKVDGVWPKYTPKDKTCSVSYTLDDDNEEPEPQGCVTSYTRNGEGCVTSYTQNKQSTLNKKISTKYNIDNSQCNVSSTKKNYFSTLKGTRTEDVDSVLDPKKAKGAERAQKASDTIQKKKLSKEVYKVKLESKNYESFTSDDFVCYYDEMLKVIYPTSRLSDASKEKFKKEFDLGFELLGITREQVKEGIDKFIMNYKTFSGVDSNKYPVPQYPSILMYNGGSYLKQALGLVSQSGSPVYIESDASKQQGKEISNKRKDTFKEWCDKWALERIEEDVVKFSMPVVGWLSKSDIVNVCGFFVTRGLLHGSILNSFKNKDKDVCIDYYINFLKPAYDNYLDMERSAKQVEK